MQGVEAGADLHPFHLVHGLAVGKVEAGLFQCRTPVGEVVLQHQILALLGIDIGRFHGASCVAHRGKALKAVGLEHRADLEIGARRDLVDHGPGEGDLAAVLKVSLEALVAPGPGKGGHGRFELVAVVGAVVGADHRDRISARAIAFEQQRSHTTHIALGLVRRGQQVCLDVFSVQAVALLGDGKGRQLQGRIAEDFLQPLLAAVEIGRLCHRAEDVLLHAAVGFQRHDDGQIVKLVSAAIHALNGDDALVQHALVQKALGGHAVQGLENVARAEVQPGGIGLGACDHGRAVVFRQTVALGLPFRPVFQRFIVQLHFPFVSLSIRSQAPSMYIMPRARSYSP